MKIKQFIATVLTAGVLLAPLLGFAEEKKAEKKAYPLKTCVVSGEKLDSMGDDGREIQFCCKSCLKDFKKTPAKYLKKLDEAEKPAKK